MCKSRIGIYWYSEQVNWSLDSNVLFPQHDYFSHFIMIMLQEQKNHEFQLKYAVFFYPNNIWTPYENNTIWPPHIASFNWDLWELSQIGMWFTSCSLAAGCRALDKLAPVSYTRHVKVPLIVLLGFIIESDQVTLESKWFVDIRGTDSLVG